MTPKRFQDWLEKLAVPGANVDFRANMSKERFEIVVTYEVGEHVKSCPIQYPFEKLNDTRHTTKMMDEFVPKMLKAIEQDRKRSTL